MGIVGDPWGWFYGGEVGGCGVVVVGEEGVMMIGISILLKTLNSYIQHSNVDIFVPILVLGSESILGISCVVAMSKKASGEIGTLQRSHLRKWGTTTRTRQRGDNEYEKVND